MRNILFSATSLVRRTTLHSSNIACVTRQTNSTSLFYPTLTPLARSFAKARKGSDIVIGTTTVEVRFPVEEDPQKLVDYVCGTDFLKDSEPVKIKPDSDYPSWLWSVRLEKPPDLEDLDPNSKEYWIRTKEEIRKYKEGLKKIKKV